MRDTGSVGGVTPEGAVCNKRKKEKGNPTLLQGNNELLFFWTGKTNRQTEAQKFTVIVNFFIIIVNQI